MQITQQPNPGQSEERAEHRKGGSGMFSIIVPKNLCALCPDGMKQLYQLENQLKANLFVRPSIVNICAFQPGMRETNGYFCTLKPEFSFLPGAGFDVVKSL